MGDRLPPIPVQSAMPPPNTHTPHLLEKHSFTTPRETLSCFVESQRLGLEARPGPGEDWGTVRGGACHEVQALHGHPVRLQHSLQPDSFSHVPGE